MSNDPSDLSPLTPGHFLIGSPLLSLPERGTDDATPLPIRIQVIKKMISGRDGEGTTSSPYRYEKSGSQLVLT